MRRGISSRFGRKKKQEFPSPRTKKNFSNRLKLGIGKKRKKSDTGTSKHDCSSIERNASSAGRPSSFEITDNHSETSGKGGGSYKVHGEDYRSFYNEHNVTENGIITSKIADDSHIRKVDQSLDELNSSKSESYELSYDHIEVSNSFNGENEIAIKNHEHPLFMLPSRLRSQQHKENIDMNHTTNFKEDTRNIMADFDERNQVDKVSHEGPLVKSIVVANDNLNSETDEKNVKVEQKHNTLLQMKGDVLTVSSSSSEGIYTKEFKQSTLNSDFTSRSNVLLVDMSSKIDTEKKSEKEEDTNLYLKQHTLNQDNVSASNPSDKPQMREIKYSTINGNSKHRFNSQLVEMHSKIDQRKAEIARKRQELAKKRETKSTLKNQPNTSMEIQKLEKKLMEANNEIAKLNNERRIDINELSDLRNRLKNSLEEKVKTPNKEFSRASVALKQARIQFEELEKERLQQQTRIKELEGAYKKSRTRIEELELDLRLQVFKEEKFEEKFDSFKPRSLDSNKFGYSIKNRIEENFASKENARKAEIMNYPQDSTEYHDELEINYQEMIDKWENDDSKQSTRYAQDHGLNLSGLELVHEDSKRMVLSLGNEVHSCSTNKLSGQSIKDSSLGRNASLKTEQRKFKKLNKKIEELSRKLVVSEMEVNKLANKVEKSRSKDTASQEEITKLKVQINELSKKLLELGGKNSESEVNQMNISTELNKELRNELVQKQKETQYLEMDIKLQKENYEFQLQELRDELETSKSKVARLETQFSRFIRNEPIQVFEEDEKKDEEERQKELLELVALKDKELERKEDAYQMQVDQVEGLRESLHSALSNIADLEFELRFSNAKIEELSQLNVDDKDEEVRAKLREKAIQYAEVETKLEKSEAALAKQKELVDKLEQEKSNNKDKVAELSSIWDAQVQVDAMRKELQLKALRIADHLNASLARIEELEIEKERYKVESFSLKKKLEGCMKTVDDLGEKLGIVVIACQEKDALIQSARLTEARDDVFENTFKGKPQTRALESNSVLKSS